MNNGFVTLDFAKAGEISHYSCRRAFVFLGIAENVAKIDPPISHELVDRANINLLPEKLSEENRRAFVDEFLVWTIANALHELMEGHSLFLTEVYHILLQINSPRMSANDMNAQSAKFSNKSLIDQRNKIEKMTRTSDPYASMFLSMAKARNCLAHRNGVVSEKDVDPRTNELEVRWRFSALHTVGENGELVYADVNRGINDNIVPGMKISLVSTEKSKSFRLGDVIALDRFDLYEMINGFLLSGLHCTDAIAAHANAKGTLVWNHGAKQNINSKIPSGKDLFSIDVKIAKD